MEYGFRLRLGDYRILFDVEEDLISIQRVRHRKHMPALQERGKGASISGASLLEAVKISRQIAKLHARLQELLEDGEDAKAILEARKAKRGKKGFSVSESRELLGL